MGLVNFTKKVFCCAVFAASALTANAADRLLIVGDAVWCGYSIDNSIVMFNSEETPDVFTATVYLEASKEFKFLTEPEWLKPEYRAGDANVVLTPGEAGTLVSSDENPNDSKFSVAESANYDIACNLGNKTILLTKSAYQENPVKHTGLWIVGGAAPGGWSIADGYPMTQDAQNPLKFTAKVNLAVSPTDGAEFKLAINNQTGFGQTFYQRDATDDGKMVFGGDDNKWSISEDGVYDIEVNLLDMTISCKKTVDVPDAINEVKTAGSVAADAYYTVSGLRVNNPSKGLYIQNGKKVIIK